MLRQRLLALAPLLIAASLFPACSSTDETDANTLPPLAENAKVQLEMIGRYAGGEFATSAAEICAYDPVHAVLFVVNSAGSRVDVLSMTDPSNPVPHEETPSLDVTGFVPSGEGSPTSVAVHRHLVAIAIEDSGNPQGPGAVVVYDTANLKVPAGQISVGVMPDMVTFSPDGKTILTANEGEPNDLYTVDPEGSISIIDISNGAPAMAELRATFTDFNEKHDELIAKGVRIFAEGPNGPATVAQDLEPEYIAVSPDSTTAWCTLQENNALAIIDIASAMVTDIVPLGYKDLRLEENALDPSDSDGANGAPAVNFQTAIGPIFGMYQPDSIKTLTIGETAYLVTANEGDARDYTGYSEEGDNRIEDLTLDSEAFPDGSIKDASRFGRLRVTTAQGDIDDDGAYEELYAFGARSFSIWDTSGRLIWDSGDQLERISGGVFPRNFNTDNEETNDLDDRSDDMGPEPAALTVGEFEGRTYVFVGLERIGGVMVYDVTDPTAPEFQHYITTRDFTLQPLDTSTDLGPAGIAFISADDSPTGMPLVCVANEISGSTVIFQMTKVGGSSGSGGQ